MDTKRFSRVFASLNHLKFIVILGLSCSLLLFFSFIPKGDDPVDKLVTALQKWTEANPQEKVYLQMDKPYYALGDTIWFKGYVTIGSRHQLSALSGALYVDLITEKDSIMRSLKLPITSGMVMGDLTLGDDFKEGSYRIRAYTQWMRNAGEDYFFDQTFTVGNVVSNNIVTKADYQYKNIDNKPVLTATLNYTNDEGKPLADRAVHYQIFINKRSVWSASAKTDINGNIPVRIANEGKMNLAGAYIHTTLDGSDKYTIIRDFPIKAALSQSDVQFFPESGNLVNGVTSHIAFKAVGIDGTGIPIKGTITDNENKEIADLETLHAGMGSFLLRPEAGKTYTANISFADGATKTIALPQAVADGYVLSVYQPNKDSVLVRINTTNNVVSTSPTLSFVAQVRGETVFASSLKITKVSTSIWLDKKAFPGGIAQFTLFNDAGEPLNERVAFIRGDDHMNLKIATAKASYSSKERVQVELQAADSKFKPVPGNFSISVIDESKVPFEEANESTIFSNLLLTSDLKGYIEKPNYYFVNDSEETDRALDNLMLTQGYRRFAWKEVVNTTNIKPVFEAEGLGFKVSGKVTTLGTKPVPGANVILNSVKAGVTKVTTTDADGRFKFDGIFLTDSIKFALQARTAKNSDKVKIILDTIPKSRLSKNRNMGDVSTNITATLKAYIDNTKKEDDIYEKFGQLDKVHRLREVRIHAKKIEEPIYTTQGMYRIPEGHSDQEIIMKDVDNSATLSTYLANVLKAAIFKPAGFIPLYPYLFDPQVPGYVPAQIILDGRKIDGDEAAGIFDNSTIDITDIVKIDVVRTNMALKAMLNNGVALMIYTRRGMVRHSYNPSLVNITPKGFNKVREFYSPRYDRPGNAASLPDLRTTVYWNPYLKTDVSGKATFNYFNADGPGTYKVVIEGINAAGELGRAVYRYTVDEGQATGFKTSVPTVDKGIAQITKPLDSLLKKLPVEKVYLHTDKPYYNIGDTLWFKSYVVDNAHQPSKLSGLLYVELDDDTSEIVRRISIPVKDGIGWGQIPLSNIIFREGGYTLRAYSNWMQNFGQDHIFTQRFYLGKPAADSWLASSSTTIRQAGGNGNDQLQVELKLSKADKLLSPLALKKVQVKLYDEWHYIYKEDMQTGIDGSIKFNSALKDTMEGRRIRVQIISLDQADDHKVLQIPLLVNRKQNIDLQFLPEGGDLVAGLRSTVGFKAIGEDGKGTPVAGSIYDSKGNEIVTFATIHNGMGSLEFTPKDGETYIARLSEPVDKKFRLPKISPTGTVMHIDNSEGGDNLKISLAGLASLEPDSACYLVGTSGGAAYYTQKIARDQTSITIPKSLFPTGVTRFTLFKVKRPLNQRVVFIDHHDQLSINIRPNKISYANRDSVGLEIEVKDRNGIPIQGNFSLAVTDDSQVRPDSLDNNSMATSLLLNSELRGHIESPGYYINRKDKQAWLALDNLMLTQGWTGYQYVDKKDRQPGQPLDKPVLVQGLADYRWADVFAKPKLIKGAKEADRIKFKPEKELVITGKVTNLANIPIKDASVLISSQKPAFLATASVDTSGVYVFKNLPPIDSGSFFIQANSVKGKKIKFGAVSVDRLKTLPVPERYKDPILPWYVNTNSSEINYLKRVVEKDEGSKIKLTGHVLKEVKIKGKKIIKNSVKPLGPGESDEAYDDQDIKESATTSLYDLLMQKIPGLRVLGATNITYHDLDLTVPVLAFNGMTVDLRIDGGPVSVDVDVMNNPRDVTHDAAIVTNILPGKNRDEYSPVTNEVVDAMRNIKLADIKGLEIIYSRKYTNRICFQCDPFAIVELTTDKGMGWYKPRPPGVVSYRPLPVLYPQQFYSPRYNVAPSSVIEPDYRSTIYWQPNIYTDQNGRAKVSFYTSDIKDKYTIKISGIDGNGGIGDGSFKLNDNTKAQTF